MKKKLKAKMKYADKLEIPYVIVIGDNEIESGRVKVKRNENWRRDRNST